MTTAGPPAAANRGGDIDTVDHPTTQDRRMADHA